ncbi:hypothetical protein BDR04DRAFT_1141391 [Suillus decipiens]|nr:hypothetical protein BDR04DRAFT_1141391 [Suillus decipiens]
MPLRYIEEIHPRGSNLWQLIENRIEFVFTYPNGWEGPQQIQIRLAAVLSLIPSTEDNGEDDGSSQGQDVIVIDVGGGRIDFGAYSIALYPTLIKEIAAAEFLRSSPELLFRRAHGLLQDIFDWTTKLRICNRKDPAMAYIKFGTIRDKNPQYDIRSALASKLSTLKERPQAFRSHVYFSSEALLRTTECSASCKNIFSHLVLVSVDQTTIAIKLLQMVLCHISSIVLRRTAAAVIYNDE